MTKNGTSGDNLIFTWNIFARHHFLHHIVHEVCFVLIKDIKTATKAHQGEQNRPSKHPKGHHSVNMSRHGEDLKVAARNEIWFDSSLSMEYLIPP